MTGGVIQELERILVDRERWKQRSKELMVENATLKATVKELEEDLNAASLAVGLEGRAPESPEEELSDQLVVGKDDPTEGLIEATMDAYGFPPSSEAEWSSQSRSTARSTQKRVGFGKGFLFGHLIAES